MAFLTTQKQGEGRYTTIYATVANWGELKGGRHGAIQQRLYIGRLDDEGRVRVSKSFAGGNVVMVELSVLRERVHELGSLAEVKTWLRELCAAAAPAAPARTAPAGSVFVPPGDLGTAIVGQQYALTEIARALRLDQCLSEAFGETVALALLHLAMHQAVRGEPQYLARAWLQDLWLPPALADFDFSSPGLSRLMDAIGRRENDRQKFYQEWLAARRHPRVLIYDTTSISTYAGALEAAAYGYNRDGEKLPQENLALVCDREDRLPLFCRLIPGSVPDVATLAATARILQALGLQDLEFTLDRGFFSNSNVQQLLDRGQHFNLGVLLHGKQSLALVAKHRSALNSPKHSIFHEGTSLRYMHDMWQVDMGRDSSGRRRQPQQVHAHIYFDVRRHADRVAELEESVFNLEAQAARQTFRDIAEARRWLAENTRPCAKCLGIDTHEDGSVTISRRPRIIASRSANFGYQIIIRDRPSDDPTTVLADNRSRDRAEKLFDLLKNEDGQYRLRTGNQSVAEGRIFLAFLALVLRTEVESRLRQAGLLKRITVDEFFAEMGSLRAIRLPTGDRLLREITKRQREWLHAIGLTTPQL